MQLKRIELKHQKKKSSFWSLFTKVMLGVILLSGAGIAFLIWSHPVGPSVFNYVLGKESLIQKDDQGRINILLLGMAGGKHDGATLTDTIMVASYNPTSKRVTLISLPRDIWIDKHRSKINSLYQLGQSREEGFNFAKEEIGEMLGFRIPYAIRIDFGGFIQAVDLVGGLDVEVVKSFDDYLYPLEGKEDELCDYQEEERDIDEGKSKELGLPSPGRFKVLLDKDGNIATSAAEPQKNIIYTEDQVFKLFGCRFEHLRYEQGQTHMNGEEALKFVRSRHGTNGEGSDFARSHRQQLVLQSFKDKILSLGTLTDPAKIISLLQTFGSSVETDIPEDTYIEFVDLIKNVDSVKNYVIDGAGKDPLLITPLTGNYGGAWVLMPEGGNYERIHQFVDSILTEKIEDEATGSGEVKTN